MMEKNDRQVSNYHIDLFYIYSINVFDYMLCDYIK